MRDLIDRGILSRLDDVYRRSFLSKHAARDVLIKPIFKSVIRLAETMTRFDTSPIRPLPQRLSMLSGASDRRVIGLVSLFLTRHCVVWDVGANIGYIARQLVKAGGNAATAYAFEPNPELLDVLTHNLKPVRSARVIPVALGSADGVMTLYVGDYCVMASASKSWSVNPGMQTASIREHVVPVRSGDSLIRAGEAQAPDVVKIDVEGYEMAVLDGLHDHIVAARNLAVICEYSPLAMQKAGFDPAGLFYKLWDYKFRVWQITHSGKTIELSNSGDAARLQAQLGPNYVNLLAVKGHEGIVNGW